jgi:hypothetical protein
MLFFLVILLKKSTKYNILTSKIEIPTDSYNSSQLLAAA